MQASILRMNKKNYQKQINKSKNVSIDALYLLKKIIIIL